MKTSLKHKQTPYITLLYITLQFHDMTLHDTTFYDVTYTLQKNAKIIPDHQVLDRNKHNEDLGKPCQCNSLVTRYSSGTSVNEYK